MARWKRTALGLLVAYVAWITLYAACKSAEVHLFRRIYEHGPKTSPQQDYEGYPLMMIAKDYGVDLTPLETWSIRIADIQRPLLVPAFVSLFLLGLGAGLIPKSNSPKIDED